MLKKLSLLLLCAVMVCFSAGCVSSLMGGSKLTEENAQKQLVRGQTTKQQVRDFFGEPTKVMTFKGGEEWSYIEAPDDEESAKSAQYNRLGHTAVDIGSEQAGNQVTMKHGFVAGQATKAGSGAVGHTAVDTAAPADGPATRALIVTFDKQGVVKDYRVR